MFHSSSKRNVLRFRIYLLDIVLALVPSLDEKRLESLEGKLKQLFSTVNWWLQEKGRRIDFGII